MRSLTMYLAVLVSVVGIATASQAGIEIGFEIGGQQSVNTPLANVLTVEIFLTATGTTSVSGYQFAMHYKINDVRDAGSLVQAPTHGGAGAWTSGGAGLGINTSTAYVAAISASTITAGTEITAADGKVKIGSLTFQTFLAAVSTNGIDITGCYNCSTMGFVGDGAVGDVAGGSVVFADGLTTFNGVAVNIPEPTTAALLGLGLLGLGAAGRRRKEARSK